ncbi:single-stranded DNA-binding protein [Nesterenkonia marinintestina]|uniref:single-stranded DNA-binding protein n=1 Tax=Nesterenkonia marinintestina TaxID=2979865 RepID=UPI0021C191DB|nr:single-stranded DNA-binding protein [Nesterenkonia sp. GX14115]
MKQNLGQNTITGNLVADPQWSRHGKVVEFTLAENSRYQDRDTQEWKDGPTTYHDVKVRNEQLAAHCVESLRKGQRATATGGHQVEAYINPKDGSPRLGNTLWATDVAGSLRFDARPAVAATAQTVGADVHHGPEASHQQAGPSASDVPAHDQSPAPSRASSAEPSAGEYPPAPRSQTAGDPAQWQQLANDTANRLRGPEQGSASGPGF